MLISVGFEAVVVEGRSNSVTLSTDLTWSMFIVTHFPALSLSEPNSRFCPWVNVNPIMHLNDVTVEGLNVTESLPTGRTHVVSL